MPPKRKVEAVEDKEFAQHKNVVYEMLDQVQDALQVQELSQCQDPQLVDAKVDPLPWKQKAQSAHKAHLNKTIQVIKQGLLEQKIGREPITIVIGQNPIIQEESCSESSDDEIVYKWHNN